MQKEHTKRKIYQAPQGFCSGWGNWWFYSWWAFLTPTTVTFIKLDDFCSKAKDCKNILQTEALSLQHDLVFKSLTITLEFILNSTPVHILLKYKVDRK